MNDPIKLEICAETRVGSRETNEDSYTAIYGPDLTAGILGVVGVADGIGGLGSGHVASSTALTTLGEVFRKLLTTHKSGVPPLLDWLSFCFHKANSDVLRMGLILPELKGMGSTCTAAAVTDSQIHVCHVGDSRAYLWRNGILKQLTADEWFSGLRQGSGSDKENPSKSSAKSQPGVTLVTQAIGWQPMITPAKTVEHVQRGDIALLCTDGLTDSLAEVEIERLIAAGGELAVICRNLADEAAARAGADNVTVTLARLV